MATLTSTSHVAGTVNRTEIQSAALAACDAAGDVVPNPGNDTILIIENGDASAHTVTVAAQNTARPAGGSFPAMTLADFEAEVAAGEMEIIGPFPDAYNNASGNIEISYDAVTSMKIKAVKLNLT